MRRPGGVVTADGAGASGTDLRGGSMEIRVLGEADIEEFWSAAKDLVGVPALFPQRYRRGNKILSAAKVDRKCRCSVV